MMNNNKILTVSYGTFSCTLEGFDDSFGTMKAIAEYFRDLAADDRYFGAEPPQPDAEMLARIAEREISRRVEARQQEGRIVLSAEPDATAPAPAVTAPTADAAAQAPIAADVATLEAEPAVAVSDQTEDAPASQEAVAADTAVAALIEADEDAVPADAEPSDPVTELAQDEAAPADPAPTDEEPAPIDAVTPQVESAPEADAVEALSQEPETLILENPLPVSDDDAEPVTIFADQSTEAAVATPMAVEEPVAEAVLAEADNGDIDLDAIAAATADAALAEDTAEETSDQSNEDTLSAVESFFADAAADREEAEAAIEAEEEVKAEAAPAPDSIAAKLQRIRAVVSAGQDDIAKTAMFEDEHAEGFDADADIEDFADTDAPLTGRALIDDVVADFEATEDVADEEDGSVEIAEALENITAQQVDTPEDEDDLEDDLAALLDSDTDADEAVENLFEAPQAGIEPKPEAPVEAPIKAQPEAPAPRRARVIKVKRAQIEEALTSGQIEEIGDDAPGAPTSSLSPEEEAELQAELDAVAAELPQEPAPEAPAAPPAEAPEVAREEAAVEPDVQVSKPPVADADVQRLMAEADNQMEEPEGSRRRNAFQHLKAAVMAKKADSGLGRTSTEDEGAFRSDLADVVVPRRPTAEGAPRVERPAAEPVPPLKLVAEQRVDGAQGAEAPHPVRPRRIVQQEAAAPAEADATSTFADYAADMGAHSLPEMLEAAASYLSFVEGREQFSRPQLMNKVRQVQPAEFSREDGLRSFGQLLRAGKIEKRQGGRFTVTDDIGYRPDERAAG